MEEVVSDVASPVVVVESFTSTCFGDWEGAFDVVDEETVVAERGEQYPVDQRELLEPT